MERNPLFGIKARKMRGTGHAGDAWTDWIGQAADSMGLVPGQHLSFWIGQAAKRAREDAGLSLEAVAADLKLGKETLDRFEKGQRQTRGLERILVAYAQLAGVPDARDIVAQAVRLWYESGFDPAVKVEEDLAVGPGEGPVLSEPEAEPTSRRAATQKAGRGQSARRP